MSRGPGVLQRWLFLTISAHGKPVTFADLRAIAEPLRPSTERSLRRALHSMVRDHIIIELGSGGRADPHRYAINPALALIADRKD